MGICVEIQEHQQKQQILVDSSVDETRNAIKLSFSEMPDSDAAQAYYSPEYQIQSLEEFYQAYQTSSKAPSRCSLSQILSSQITTMSTLSKLHLTVSDITIPINEAEQMAQSISELTNLTEIQFEDKSGCFTGSGINSLLSAISKLTNLKSLHLSLQYYNMSNDQLLNLVKQMKNLVNLKALTLHFNSHSLLFERAITVFFDLVKSLNLDSCLLHMQNDRKFLKKEQFDQMKETQISQSPYQFNILVLELSSYSEKQNFSAKIVHPELSQFGVDSIPYQGFLLQLFEKLKNLPFLEQLNFDLRSNNLSLESASKLTEEIAKFKNLLSLEINFSNNLILQKSNYFIFWFLCRLHKLHTLNLKLSSNKQSEKPNKDLDLSDLPFDLSFNISSLSLTLDHNTFGEDRNDNLAMFLSKLNCLTDLELNFKKFSNKHIQRQITANNFKGTRLQCLKLNLGTTEILHQEMIDICSCIQRLLGLNTLSLCLPVKEPVRNLILTKIKRIVSLSICQNQLAKIVR